MAKNPSPLAAIFAALNWIAFAGWSYVLFRLVASSYPTPDYDGLVDELRGPILGLEAICVVEVVRILVGDLPGNFVLGAVLHAIRFTAVTQILPANPPDHWTVPAVLGSWAATEVGRYPMYMFPNVEFLRSARMVVPLFTFPVGCFSEAYGAYLVFADGDTPAWLRAVLGMVLFVNGVLGPALAYPALLKKGLPVLGLAKKREKRTAKKE